MTSPSRRSALRWLLAALVGLQLPVAPAHAQPSSNLCSPGYVLGFFNGVWNEPTQAGAYAGLDALYRLQGDTFNGEPVVPELFYNHTGSTVGASFLQDIAETFIQRADEIDASGMLSQRFEFLWDVVTDNDRGLWDRLIQAVPAAEDALDALYSDIVSKSVAGYSLLLSNPPTQADLAAHHARLDELVSQGQKLLLVAHSQGNLFVNRAHDRVAQQAQAGSFATAHVAPASPTLRGEYLLADIDVVINGLRIVGTVPPENLFLPFSMRDVTGHTLTGTYLDSRRAGRAAVKTMLDAAIGGLVTPVPRANIGFFTITLTWNGTGDVDLHTFEPNGTHVYYASRTGSSGFLDVDNVVANGPEHYYATCNADLLQAGTYSVGINNYARATGRTATVQVASLRDGELLTSVLGVGPERGSAGNASPIPVMRVIVARDAATGEYRVEAR